jgi:hypothetical protein
MPLTIKELYERLKIAIELGHGDALLVRTETDRETLKLCGVRVLSNISFDKVDDKEEDYIELRLS